MSYEPYDEDTATAEDRLAWLLCQIIDDDAPLRWTLHRFTAGCLLAERNGLKEIVAKRDEEDGLT